MRRRYAGCAPAHRKRVRIGVAACALAACALAACATSPEPAIRYVVQGDAIPAPLTQIAGNPERGREVVVGRDASCLYCHAVPGPERFMGTIGPGLAGVGARYTPGQLRLRVADPTRVNPGAVMPAYFRVDGLDGVAQNLRGRPILSAQQVEDVVAWLTTLK